MGNHETNTELRTIKITAGIAGLIGLVGLIALMSQGSWAADANPPTNPRTGFTPGPRSFSNPFANTGNPSAANPAAAPSGRGDLFDDDESDDEFNFGDDAGSARGAANGAGGAGGAGGGNANPALNMGGTPGSGVIAKNTTPSIRIDSETGEGSKELVTDFNYPDADILDIAKTLGKLTGKNFILDKDVKGRITIISNAPITVADAWKAFLTALDINGFALIPSGNFIRIARQRDARDKQLKTYTGDYSPDTDALITRVIPLKYINAEEVARTFRSFMPANARIIGYEQTNTVIVTDTGSNIAKMIKMLDILDVEGYDAGIEVVPVKYASAVELSKLIDQLLPGTGAGAGTPGAPRFGGGGMSRFNARRTKEGGIINTIIADERTNTMIVHANTKGADQIRELVAKLDKSSPAPSGGGKVHVVYLQFAEAEAISTTLNNLSSSTPGGSARPPGSTGTGTGVNPTAASLFEGSIRVSPDKSTNALVVTASPADFVTVQRVINRLDIPRDEVYVEVVIMEISLNRQFQFSANTISPASGIGFTPNSDLFNFITNPLGTTGAVIGYKAGGGTTVTVNNQNFQVSNVQGLIRAIQTNSNANVLATPQIIALDNTEANFEQSEKIPIPTSTAVQGAGVSTSITKEPVTLSIKIKPQINKLSNFVKLDLESKLGSIEDRQLPTQVQGLAYATLDRTAKTTVVVGDADTVVIGGLIRDNVNETVSKVPILGDIPLLGWLFKSKQTQSQKTNLLVFMTPHIVRQYEKVRAILDRKLKERDDFLEGNASGEDPFRKVRDDMIRSLPDIKQLTDSKPKTAVAIDEDDSSNAKGDNPFTGGNSAPAARTGAGNAGGNTNGEHVPNSTSTLGAPPAGDAGPGPGNENLNPGIMPPGQVLETPPPPPNEGSNR